MTMDTKELLRKAVTIYKSKLILPEIKERMQDEELIRYIQEAYIAKVIRRQDEMITDAIMKAVDEGLVRTAFLIDRDFIQDLFSRMEPKTVWFEAHGSATCHCCGKDIYRGFNEKYCGFCGQALAWEITP